MGDLGSLRILHRAKFYQHKGIENNGNSQKMWEFPSTKGWFLDGDAQFPPLPHRAEGGVDFQKKYYLEGMGNFPMMGK